MHLEQVDLTGAQQTALATLYGKAMDFEKKDSVLQDRKAHEAFERLDYDFTRLRTRGTDYTALGVRAKAYDTWAQQYLDDHPDCTVLHLGCGLDTRVYRIDPPTSVRWYDVDMPDVIELRRRLFPQRSGTHLVASSVTDPHLLDDIAGDTAVLVIAEGLTPYLRAVDGLAMLRRITEHFPAGEMLLDGYGRWGVWLLQRYGCVKASGAQIHWHIDDPGEVERAVPGLHLDRELWYPCAPGMERHYSRLSRWMLRAVYHITPLRRLGRPLRFRFGTAPLACSEHDTLVPPGTR